MNIIKIKVDFENRELEKEGILLVSGDYNSTKLIFEFDKEYEGRKVFELAKPKEKDEVGEAIFVKEIVDNEVVLVAYDEEGKEVSIFSEEGKYPFEVSLYGENSKLTSLGSSLRIKQESVRVGDEVIERYLPIFDEVMNEANETINRMNEMMENFSGGGTGGISEEKDPTVPEHVKNITIGDIENWNNVDELENVLRNILEAIQSGVSASMVIEEIEQLIVEYFENKTVEEVEA